MKKYLYLPLEIVIREHDGKTTLAHQAVIDGWTVVMGPKLHLYRVADQLPEGVFLIKSATPYERPQIANLRAAGHKVCSLDEEGVVTFKEFLGDNVRFSRKTIELISHIFFWGSAQQGVFNETFPEFAKQGTVSGSPRLEFWRDYAADVYAPQVKEIKKKYGKFILLPSSFGIANNVLGKKHGVELTKKQYGGAALEVTKFLVGQAEQNLVTFKEYLEFLPEMAAAYPNMNFIVRPHPSEDHEVWLELAKDHNNIHVVYEGTVTPWILASEAIFHFKSTTAIEAHLMGKTVLTYMPPYPQYMKKFTLEQPLAVSHIAGSRAELLDLIGQVESGKIKSKKGKITGILKDWISVQDKKSSAARILEKMDHYAPDVTRKLITPELPKYAQMREKIDEFLLYLDHSPLWARYVPSRLRARLNGLAYGRRKYMGLDIAHTKAVLDVINKLTAQKVKAKPLTETLFVIQGGK